jgi:hypothetical protein
MVSRIRRSASSRIDCFDIRPYLSRETPAKQPYSTCIAFFETTREKSLWNRFDAVFGVNPVTRSTSAGPMPI